MDEEAVLDGILASSIQNDFEDYGEGESEALEHVRGWKLDAKAVEEEGRGGSFHMVGY